MRASAQKRDDVVQTMAFACAALLSMAAHAQGFVYENAPFAKFVPAGGADNSEFGFSLAYFENEQQGEKLFLIGSPGQDNNTGALYACPVAGVDKFPNGRVSCSKLQIEDQYVGVKFDDTCESNTDHQRLGTALTVSGKEIMICAPNWRTICTQPYGSKFSMFIGTCYSSSNVIGPYGNFTPVYYYKTDKHPRYYSTDGFCQAGFSVAFTEKELGGLVMGAPGCHGWAGDVFWADVDDADSLERRGLSFELSQLVEGSTSSTTKTIRNRYMGYAVAEGTFNGRQMVVSSAPKESTLDSGNAVSDAATYILEHGGSKSLKIWASLFISGEDTWKFAYCGFSLAVVDFDLDGLDDVAVGCPYYGEDRGAFVIFFQRREQDGTYAMKKEDKNFPGIEVDKKPVNPKARVGNINERFGSAIAGIGDIDGDGFLEFAVGAPGAQSGRGRVYIYRGGQGGLSSVPCQVLDAAADQKNFGWALASGADLLTVAMFSPAEVAVYRPRQVLLPELRLLTDVRLPVVEVQAVPVQVCLRYSRRDAAPDATKRRFEASLELDKGKDISRLQFADGTSGRTRSIFIDAAAGVEECVSFDVKKKSKESELVSYLLRANATFLASDYPDVVVDPLYDRDLDKTSALEPELFCDDSECVTEVVVSMQHEPAIYTYDGKEKLFLIVDVGVTRDPAYFVVLNFDTHGALSYSQVEGLAGLQCEGNTQFSCKVDILEDKQVQLRLTLLPAQALQEGLTQRAPQFHIAASLAASSRFSPASRPNASLAVPVSLSLDFDVAGLVAPDSIDVGKEADVTVTFSLKNGNGYSYGVSFSVAPRDEDAGCVSNIRLLGNNTSCSENTESRSGTIECHYERFPANSEDTVEVSAKIDGKEECGAPLQGVAKFSQLPFSLSAPDEVSSPSVTFHYDQLWYEKWWVWLIVALLLLLVVLNVVIVIVYRKKKLARENEARQPKKDDAGDADETQDPTAPADAQDDEQTDARDDKGVTKPLNPQMHVP